MAAQGMAVAPALVRAVVLLGKVGLVLGVLVLRVVLVVLVRWAVPPGRRVVLAERAAANSRMTRV